MDDNCTFTRQGVDRQGSPLGPLTAQTLRGPVEPPPRFRSINETNPRGSSLPAFSRRSFPRNRRG